MALESPFPKLKNRTGTQRYEGNSDHKTGTKYLYGLKYIIIKCGIYWQVFVLALSLASSFITFFFLLQIV